jgi:hypothetical protein
MVSPDGKKEVTWSELAAPKKEGGYMVSPDGWL